MKLAKAALLVCALFCLYMETADAAPEHTLKGVVITSDGTVVREFTLTVRPVVKKPELLLRRHFKKGEFTIEGLKDQKYQIHISSPMFIPSRVDIDFKTETKPTGHRIVILHSYRNEPRFIPGSAHTVSLNALRQKIPEAAAEAYKKAVELHRDGHLEQALIEYGTAIRHHPKYLEALADVGTIFILYNRPQSALSFLRRAQQIDDCNPIVNINIAIALTEQRDYGEAMKLFRDVVKTEPRMALAHYYMAKIHHIQGKYDKAEEALQQAVEADPQLLDAWLMLANISIEQQKVDQAREALTRLRNSITDAVAARIIDEQLATLGS